jgi:hypothetical protein
MTRTQIIYVVVGGCTVVGFIGWVWLILVPAVTAYPRVWQRLAAAVLSIYVAAAMTGLGIVLGALVVPSLWDRLHS